jgi:hypothetical protein
MTATCRKHWRGHCACRRRSLQSGWPLSNVTALSRVTVTETVTLHDTECMTGSSTSTSQTQTPLLLRESAVKDRKRRKRPIVSRKMSRVTVTLLSRVQIQIQIQIRTEKKERERSANKFAPPLVKPNSPLQKPKNQNEVSAGMSMPWSPTSGSKRRRRPGVEQGSAPSTCGTRWRSFATTGQALTRKIPRRKTGDKPSSTGS